MKRVWIYVALLACSCLSAKDMQRVSTKAKKNSLQPAEVENRLAADIERLIRSADPNVHAGIEILSLKENQALYQKNEHQLFVPASSLKILTAAAALHTLGVDYRFSTKLCTDGRKKKHELIGNLYIKGAADPELSIHALEELVFALKLQGIQRISGDLCIDVSLFDEIEQGPGWMWDEGAVYYNSPVGPLVVNHGCIDIWVRPNAAINEAPTVYVRPKTDYVTILSDAKVSQEENTLTLKRRWMSKENIIDISGKISLSKEPYYEAIPLEAPHFYTACVLKELLAKNGIGLSGEIKIKKVPEGSMELAAVSSRPLSQIVEQMLKESDNLTADMLFKKIGETRFGAPGTWQKGSHAMRDFLSVQVGLDIERVIIMDGSGLSRYNLLSPHHFALALAWMKKQFGCSAEFCAALPIAGIDGTLAERMQEASVKGKVRAKTGGMTGISTLSGYATLSSGEEAVFSIMLSGFTKENQQYKAEIEDRICQLLVSN
jgi:serine-type D-Ala-D-Ala carboxypeptidase/endopeptidase (penicillin-binding protein 4)